MWLHHLQFAPRGNTSLVHFFIGRSCASCRNSHVYVLSTGPMLFVGEVYMSRYKCSWKARQTWLLQRAQDNPQRQPSVRNWKKSEPWLFIIKIWYCRNCSKINCWPRVTLFSSVWQPWDPQGLFKVGAQAIDKRAKALPYGHLFLSVGENFLNCIIIADETTICHYKPKSRWHSMQWKHTSSAVSKKFRLWPSAGKLMLQELRIPKAVCEHYLSAA